jgi:hypothetical protein
MHLLTLIPMALAVAFMIVVPLCANGAIKPNSVVGLKWEPLQASEDVWRKGHKAAIPATFIGSILALIVGAVFLAIPAAGAIGFIAAFVLLLAGFGIASVVAGRAIR